MSGWGDLLKGKFKEVIDKSTGEKIFVDVNSREYELDAKGNIIGGLPEDSEAPVAPGAQTGFNFGSAAAPAGGGAPGGGFSFGVPTSSGCGAGAGGFSFGAAAPVSTGGVPGFSFGATPAPTAGGLLGGSFGFGAAAVVERRKRKALNELGRAVGDVYVAGNGDCSQMGLGEAEELMECAVPTKVACLSAKRIVMVACGGMHTVALTEGGRLWSWGCNDDCALGRDGDESVPEIVGGALESARVAAVSAGDCHSVALLADGRVFTWGTYKDSNGYIGYSPSPTGGALEKAETPTLVEALRGVTVTSIASGSNHTLAVARGQPELYAWGCGEQGQLGRPTDKKTRVQHLLPVRPALTIGGGGGGGGASAAAGGAGRALRVLNANFATHVASLLKSDAKGDWTDAMDEYLAHRASLATPASGGFGGGFGGGGGGGGIALDSVYGGSYHSFALGCDGSVWAFGLNNMGQLGVGKETTVAELEPKRVTGTQLATATAATAAATATRARTHPSCLPTPPLAPSLSPRRCADRVRPPARALFAAALDGKGVCMLGGGEHHSIALTAAGAAARARRAARARTVRS
jgi:regulator of chromosome condensation